MDDKQKRLSNLFIKSDFNGHPEEFDSDNINEYIKEQIGHLNTKTIMSSIVRKDKTSKINNYSLTSQNTHNRRIPTGHLKRNSEGGGNNQTRESIDPSEYENIISPVHRIVGYTNRGGHNVDGSTEAPCVPYNGECFDLVGTGLDAMMNALSGIPHDEDVDIPECNSCGGLGDVNNDCNLDIMDIVQLVSSIVLNYDFTDEEWACADINSDGNVDILDAILLVNIIMGNIPQPEGMLVPPSLPEADRIFLTQTRHILDDVIAGTSNLTIEEATIQFKEYLDTYIDNRYADQPNQDSPL
jgi:hypothetical protein